MAVATVQSDISERETESGGNLATKGRGQVERIRVLVVSSFALLREGLCALLGHYPSLEVVSSIPGADAVWEQVSRSQPHVVVVDVPRADPAQVDLICGLRGLSSAPVIVAISRQSDEATLLRILKSGVQGCLSETEGAGDLVTAIETVVAGASFLCPAASRALVHGYRRRTRQRVKKSS